MVITWEDVEERSTAVARNKSIKVRLTAEDIRLIDAAVQRDRDRLRQPEMTRADWIRLRMGLAPARKP